MTIEEAELIRALSGSLDCPMAPSVGAANSMLHMDASVGGM